MKHKIVTTLIIPVIALSLCSCSIFRATIEKNLSVYNLDKYEDGAALSTCKTSDVRARFNKGQEYVPYLSLRQYASLHDSHLLDDAVSNVTRKNDKVTWSVIYGNSIYFLTQIDFKTKEVVTAGSLDAVFKTDDDTRDTSSLYFGNHTEYDAKLLGSSYYAHYSFANQDIDYFSYMGDYYLPLAFYDITYCFDTTIYFYYNYNSIYSSREVDNFYNKPFVKGNKQASVIGEMINSKADEEAPSYLVKLNSSLFLYLMDNFYGLKDYKDIKTAEDYCKQIGTYTDLFSENGAIRSQAYAETLDRLDDNHTALVAGSYVWGGESAISRQYGTGCINRTNLRNQLNNLRAQKTPAVYQGGNSPIVSSDGKTAMVLFNEFKFGTRDQIFNADGSIKNTAYAYDSFFALLNFFKTMQETGTVENVILDMSTNGGGVLGVLMKLLALISKDNTSNLFYLEAASNQLGIATTQVDSDFNSVYDTLDCYGDDFNIYLLTSDCSFSCGNAFPCLAQKMGCAKVIGQKSGGGECAVAVHYLPNGEYVYHSSNLHLGYYDVQSNAFTGFESGAQPDILVDNITDFYSIDTLSNLIQNS